MTLNCSQFPADVVLRRDLGLFCSSSPLCPSTLHPLQYHSGVKIISSTVSIKKPDSTPPPWALPIEVPIPTCPYQNHAVTHDHHFMRISLSLPYAEGLWETRLEFSPSLYLWCLTDYLASIHIQKMRAGRMHKGWRDWSEQRRLLSLSSFFFCPTLDTAVPLKPLPSFRTRRDSLTPVPTK